MHLFIEEEKRNSKQVRRDSEQRSSREFERFMKLVTALRRRSKGSGKYDVFL